MKKLFLLLAAAGLLSISLPAPTPTRAAQGAPKKIHKKANKVPNQYIVVLEDWAAAPVGDASFAPVVAEDMAANVKGKIKNVYKHALQGFTIETTEEGADLLAQDPRVKS